MVRIKSMLVLILLFSIMIFAQDQDRETARFIPRNIPNPSYSSFTTASWVNLPNTPNAVSRSCCVLVNVNGTDYLYQFGGGNITSELRRVARLNLSTNTWSNNVTTMPNAVSSGTAIAMNGDSLIYIFGGNSTVLGKTLRYNVYTNSWSTMADMPIRVTDGLVVKYNSYLIYVIGGGDGYFGANAFKTNKVQVYNTNTNSYTVVNNFPINCSMQGGGIFRDTIISIGGYTNGGNATANCYKGVINSTTLNVAWTQIASYPAGSVTRPASYPAEKEQGSGIFCTGGAINGSNPTAQSYFWNFCTQSWQNSVPNNSLARSNFKATGRGNVVYMVAGFTNTGVGICERITFNYIDGPCGNVTGISGNLNSPAEFNLAQNYPNPFNPSTKITFGIPKSSNVKITISDLSGKELQVLSNQNYSAGTHEIVFDGSAYSSGVYFYRINAGDYHSIKKMVLLK